jgi:hypothetical protein
MANIDPSIDSILDYCHFPEPASRVAIANDGFGSFHDISHLDHADIDNLAKGFAVRTQANGRISFGLKRIKLLKSVVDWTQDFYRISRTPSLYGIADRVDFHLAIEAAFERGKMRKHKKEDSDKLIAAATPTKLKKHWRSWEESFLNYLSCILGLNGVPLSYITRKDDEPDYSGEDDTDFEMLTIACAPMSGIAYQADTKKVHQLILGFVQGEDALTWIKDIMKKQDGRLDMKYLRHHYIGAGSQSVRIGNAFGGRSSKKNPAQIGRTEETDPKDDALPLRVTRICFQSRAHAKVRAAHPLAMQ